MQARPLASTVTSSRAHSPPALPERTGLREPPFCFFFLGTLIRQTPLARYLLSSLYFPPPAHYRHHRRRCHHHRRHQSIILGFKMLLRQLLVQYTSTITLPPLNCSLLSPPQPFARFCRRLTFARNSSIFHSKINTVNRSIASSTTPRPSPL